MPPTTIRYNLTRNDLLRSQIRGLLAKRSLWFLYAIGGLIVVWTNFNGPALAGQPIPVRIVATALVLAFVAGCGAAGGLFILVVGLAKKNRGLLGEHTIELGEHGLVEKTDVNESVHRWAGIYKTFSTANYIYIYVTETNFHAIPLRAFESAAHVAAFQSELYGRMNGAKRDASVQAGSFVAE
jgi:hypothetical protein